MTVTANSTPSSTSAGPLDVEKSSNGTDSRETGLNNEQQQASTVNDETESRREVTGFR